ncbi:MAG: hypothetical protein CM1200mP30_03120 [Pseudomonadota bacterium]|nr:MAG: hypothetical protein CM1200mP30_03120 [Pseudomonadota bacterium]
MAEWVLANEPPMDLWVVDIRRFSKVHQDKEWTRSRSLELYGKHYSISWPHEEHKSGRPYLKSPIFEKLKKQGACFGSKLGWERPNWFATGNLIPQDVYSFGRQNWFPFVAEEHRKVRESVAVFDQSSFAKFRVTGADSEMVLSRICANNVAKPEGTITYTQMLNSNGGIECDVTVARLSQDEYYIISGTGFRTRTDSWIRSQLYSTEEIELRDITEEWAVLSLMGPLSRKVLSKITPATCKMKFSPLVHAVILKINGHSVLALRITYVGELGWELHIPRSSAESVYKALMDEGKKYRIANAGYRAIESLRLEKGYREWGSDITSDNTPFEAGLGWAVKINSGTEFTGREALLYQQKKALKKMLACFTIDNTEVVLLGRETIIRNGEVSGWLSSGGWGYTLGKNIGYGYVRHPDGVDREYLDSGNYELEVATVRYECILHSGPLYDPGMIKVKQ